MRFSQQRANVLSAAYLASLGQSAQAFPLGGGFKLTADQAALSVSITKANKTVWSTAPGQNFISASSGVDTITGTDGNFKITPVDDNKCGSMNITKVGLESRSQAKPGKGVAISGFLNECGDASAPYTAHFWVSSDLPDRVSWDVSVTADTAAADPLNKVFLTYSSAADEDFYGLGAQSSFASLKGQNVPIFSREQGVGRGDEPTTSVMNYVNPFSGGDFFTTYTAIPQYVSTTNTAFYLDEGLAALANFDFTKDDSVTIRYTQLSVSGQVLRANSMLDAIGKVTDYTGKMEPLPKWVDDGAILGIQGGQEKVEKIVKQAADVDCPIVGAWLQDWSGTHIQSTPTGINISRLWWNWEYDEVLYPTWPDFVKHLSDQYSIRTLSYVNTFIANTSTKSTGFRRDLFEEAVNGKFLVRNTTADDTAIISSGPGIEAGILDLTNDATREWFTDILKKQVYGTGVSGFMSDFGEYTPITADIGFANLPKNTPDARVYHSTYPREWAAFQRSVVDTLDNGADQLLFYRSASLGSNRDMNLFWAGDQTTDWGRNDGIKSVTSILGHMGVSGYAYSHSDIGGYTTPFVFPGAANPTGAVAREAETLGRWGELAAVSSAVFRTHEGNIPQINAQFYTDDKTYGYFAYNARMFRALAPYRRSVLDRESAKKGWPLFRLPVLYHPEDKIARAISYESFYLGADLYVAPVLDKGVTELEVYLPGSKKNTYDHVWTGQRFTGGQKVKVPAPLGQPAVFVVDGRKSPELRSFLKWVAKEKTTKVSI